VTTACKTVVKKSAVSQVAESVVDVITLVVGEGSVGLVIQNTYPEPLRVY
jgi:hypothetical protein